MKNTKLFVALLTCTLACAICALPVFAWADEGTTGSAAGVSTDASGLTPAANIGEGVYFIRSAVKTTSALEVASSSKKNGAKVDISKQEYKPNQRWRLQALGGGYFRLLNVNSGKVLEVKGGKKKSGTVVQQNTWNDSARQKWMVVKVKGGYQVVSALSNTLVLSVKNGSTKNGTQVRVTANTSAKAQIWKMSQVKETLATGYYYFTNKNSGKRLAVKDGSWAHKANVVQATKAASLAQVFYIQFNAKTGYYTVRNAGSGKMLSVQNGGNANKTNVRQFNSNGSAAQMWHIQKKSGAYLLRAATGGRCLSVNNGSKASGANVQLYTYVGAPQRWAAKKLTHWIPEGCYFIHNLKASSNVVSIENDSTKNSANALTRVGVSSNGQRFYLRPAGDGCYTIQNVNSGRYLDVVSPINGGNVAQTTSQELWQPALGNNGIIFRLKSNPSIVLSIKGNSTDAGTNIQANTYKKNSAQRWRLKATPLLADGVYTIASSVNKNYVFDIAGASTSNGVKLQVYKSNSGNAQRFVLTHLKNNKYRISNMANGKSLTGSSGAVTQQAPTSKKNQQWKLVLNAGGSISFVSVANTANKLTLAGSAANGTKVTAAVSSGSNTQNWVASQAKGGITTTEKLSLTMAQLAAIEGTSVANVNPSNGSKYKFLDLRTYTGCTAAELDRAMLSMASWIKPGNPLYKSGKYFVEAAQKYGLNEVFLMVHACQETGWGASAYFGGYYNFYGVDAGTANGGTAGAIAASHGWTTIQKGIVGGAKYIADEWVYRKSYPQRTPYALRFDYLYANATKRYGYHHYTTSDVWLGTTASHIAEVYGYTGKAKNADYVKPKFK